MSQHPTIDLERLILTISNMQDKIFLLRSICKMIYIMPVSQEWVVIKY